MNNFLNRLRPKRWAEGAVVYQIYPRSFQDSNGDGVGDLQGIIERLDYLQDLGITAVWLSPFYPSPMADFGYDVMDYCDVDPLFGTLADFKQLLRAAHKRNIKIMVDIVPNHTSDEHPWFEASRQSRTGKYADWYIWHDPSGYSNDTPLPPNNWLDMFSGGSAWEWSETRKQFYLHSFHVKQPDLNWENPAVQEAMKNVLRFWLDLGVDGFRIDAVPFMAKDPSFTNNPQDPAYTPGQTSPVWKYKRINSQGWPRHFEYLDNMSKVLTERRYRHHPRFMVTEGYVERHNAVENYMDYYRGMDPSVATPFIFEGIEESLGAQTWRKFLHDLHAALDGHNPASLPAYAFGNHDQHRIVTRFGAERARSVAVLQLTLPGVTFIYNGEELGMHNVSVPPEKTQDPQAIAGDGRDPERTPMQWSSELGAGFTDGEPWLPLAHDYRLHNAATQANDSTSFLSLYHALIHLRTKTPAFKNGAFRLLFDTDPQILAYERTSRKSRYAVIINFKDDTNSFSLDHPGTIIVSSIDGSVEKAVKRGDLHLRSHEAIVIKYTRLVKKS